LPRCRQVWRAGMTKTGGGDYKNAGGARGAITASFAPARQ